MNLPPINNESILILYVRVAFPESPQDPYCFPIDLLELDNLTAETITNSVVSSLADHGFTEDYCKSYLVGVCTDGAATMVGKQSGVLTRLKTLYPDVVTWHCMCHRIKLAVSYAVKEINAVNHVKIFMDKLYSIYSTSPKAQRDLEKCAAELNTELRKTGRVLSTRWAASSYHTLKAVWSNFAPLHKFFSDESTAASSKKSMHKGVADTLASYEFLQRSAIMLDALEEVSELSLALQKAYQVLRRAIRAFGNQKEGEGTANSEIKD